MDPNSNRSSYNYIQETKRPGPTKKRVNWMPYELDNIVYSLLKHNDKKIIDGEEKSFVYRRKDKITE